MPLKILVTYSTRAGSTSEVAETICRILNESGADAEVKQMDEVNNLSAYSAYVIGSPIQGGQWLPEAMEFTRKHLQVLSSKPTAVFMVCMTLAMPSAEKYRDGIRSWLLPVRSLVNPVSEGYFPGKLNLKKVPSLSDRIKFRISIFMRIWKEGDHLDKNAVESWAKTILPLLSKEKVN